MVGQDEAGNWELLGPPGSRILHPGVPISASTSAVHHTIDEDMVGAPTWLETAPEVLRAPGLLALAAHRADFERLWCTPQLSGTRGGFATKACVSAYGAGRAVRSPRWQAGRSMGAPRRAAARAGPIPML